VIPTFIKATKIPGVKGSSIIPPGGVSPYVEIDAVHVPDPKQG
jgi:hypothetical protein